MEAAVAEQLLEHEAAPYRLVEIYYNDLPHCWEFISDHITRACAESHGAFTPLSVVDGLRDGQFILLAIVSDEGAVPSVLVCSVGLMPSGLSVFEVLLCGGADMKAWLPYEEQLDAYARARGCQRVRCIGRISLQKLLPHWKRTGVLLEREI